MPTITIPPIGEVIAVANAEEPTDAEDKAYNAWITARVREQIEAGAESVTVVYANGSRDRLGLDSTGALFAVAPDEDEEQSA